MKTKIEKGLKYLAAAIFLLALAVNVKVTLDDPFKMMSEQALASTSTTSGTPAWVDEVIIISSSKTVKEEYVPGQCREKTVTTTITTCGETSGSIKCIAGTNVTESGWTFVDC